MSENPVEYKIEHSSIPNKSPITREGYSALSNQIAISIGIDLLAFAFGKDIKSSISIFNALCREKISRMNVEEASNNAIVAQKEQYQSFLEENNFHE